MIGRAHPVRWRGSRFGTNNSLACPTGFLGRLIGHVMARETAAVNEAVLELRHVSDRVDTSRQGRSVSLRRQATSRPEAAVNPATSATAGRTPSRSAVAPARNAPTAYPRSRHSL